MAVYDDPKKSQNELVPSDDDLRKLTGINEEQEGAIDREAYNDTAKGLAEREGIAPASTSGQDDKPGKSQSPIGLSNAESSVGGTDQVGKGFDEGGDTRTRRQRLAAGALFGASAGRKQGTSGKGKGKKKILIFGAVGGIGLLGGLLILVVLFGSLLIPQFAQHITEYEFAKVLQTLNEEDLQITSEKVAVDSANDGLYNSIQAKYQNVRDNTWGRFDNYRPQKVIDNLETSGDLTYNYNSGVLGRQTLSGVTLDGATHDLNTGVFFNTFHPVQAFSEQVGLARDFGTSLSASLRDDGIGLIVRGSVENQIRKKLGIGLVAWVVGRYQGDTPQEAEDQMTKDAVNEINDGSAAGQGSDGQLDSAEQDAATSEQTCINDTSCLETTIDSGASLPVTTVDSLLKAGDSSIATSLASTVDPIISVGFPVCMINAGSMQNSQPTIDAQNAELQRSYYLVASAADQQKAGDTNGEAVGAMNWKLGDITQSDAEIRAAGGTVDTADEVSPQTSAAGQYSDTGILSVLTGGVIGGALTKVCGAITSPEGIGLSVALTILGAAGGDEAVDGVSGAVKSVVSNLTTQFTTKDGLKELAGTTLRDSSLIIGGTLLAKLIVAQNSGVLNSGLATGPTFDNAAEAGANLNSNQVMQNEFYATPLDDSDSAQSDLENQNYVASLTSTESVDQRYFALSNADSLLSRLATSVYSAIYGKPIFSSLLSFSTKIFNPFSSLSKLFGLLNNKSALAATVQNNSVDQHYGIVQWGWTPTEQTLMQTNDSFQPLENAYQFTQEANAYASAYPGCDLETQITTTGSSGCSQPALDIGECFTDSMGTLLADGYIVRDTSGDVNENQGKCSESVLGPADNFGGESQSVFRWRVMQSYNASLDNLTQVQNAGSSTSS